MLWIQGYMNEKEDTPKHPPCYSNTGYSTEQTDNTYIGYSCMGLDFFCSSLFHSRNDEFKGVGLRSLRPVSLVRRYERSARYGSCLLDHESDGICRAELRDLDIGIEYGGCTDKERCGDSTVQYTY